MVSLDQKTLLVVVSSLTLLTGILMFYFSKNNPSISGPSFWGAGSVSIVLGIATFILFPEMVFLKIIASSAVILGVSFYLAGVQLFNGKEINYWLILGVPCVQFIQATIFFSIFPIPYVRIALFSLLNLFLSVLTIREFLKPVTSSYKIAYRLGFAAFVILGLTSFSRLIFTLASKPQLMLEQQPVNNVLFYLYCLLSPLLLFVFVLLITSELTERLNDKIESQQKFHSIIAHDLIGPVGSISQMLNQINESEDSAKQDLDSVLEELEKMSNLTYHLLQNLLLWSRNQLDGLLPKIQTFDLNKVILKNIELQQQVSKSKKISVSYAESPGLMCQADERMIDTVIRNLLSNAFKFTHPKGKIAVVCEMTGSNVQIKISDSGVGMSEATFKHLFVNHHLVVKEGTGGDRGTGLGLTLCKDFVEQNLGSLKIFSEENVGTEVLVTLPIC